MPSVIESKRRQIFHNVLQQHFYGMVDPDDSITNLRSNLEVKNSENWREHLEKYSDTFNSLAKGLVFLH